MVEVMRKTGTIRQEGTSQRITAEMEIASRHFGRTDNAFFIHALQVLPVRYSSRAVPEGLLQLSKG
ncbi:MAG: hypothetical protein HPY58_03125 [Firmicutes bacterium]|nr:hypothetical protein [Bacillota bacterium]